MYFLAVEGEVGAEFGQYQGKTGLERVECRSHRRRIHTRATADRLSGGPLQVRCRRSESVGAKIGGHSFHAMSQLANLIQLSPCDRLIQRGRDFSILGEEGFEQRNIKIEIAANSGQTGHGVDPLNVQGRRADNRLVVRTIRRLPAETVGQRRVEVGRVERLGDMVVHAGCRGTFRGRRSWRWRSWQ